ncbi:hypothetical protein Dvina_06140 [Dactylosporangium vinaceum]|uniref:Uncharacterized protein n=1 Tax=Dactylosporangium vinaceum TaxID=53362 RepID=A0ABV5MSR1_9ACTN|nr:hypothetical protein [Dactylosporangium vinaceum]UAB97700.1 hypothetical protein Dvina_06140 [Dactylosporangium vinaceum]
MAARTRWAALALATALAAGSAPAPAGAAVPDPLPKAIHLGGLHLTPGSGTGADVPSFTAEHPCRAGTHLANVNAIDLNDVEQTLSRNVEGDALAGGGFGAAFLVDMATVLAALGTPGRAESFLFLVDCRTGAGHGSYTDAVIVDFDAGGAWRVRAAPESPGSSESNPIAIAGIAAALICLGAALWLLRHRRRPAVRSRAVRNQKGMRIPS